LKRVGITNSGGSGFSIFIFMKFSRVVKFLLLRPALDCVSVLLLSGFTNFLYRIFKGLFLELLHTNFDIERTIMGKGRAYVIPHII